MMDMLKTTVESLFFIQTFHCVFIVGSRNKSIYQYLNIERRQTV